MTQIDEPNITENDSKLQALLSRVSLNKKQQLKLDQLLIQRKAQQDELYKERVECFDLEKRMDTLKNQTHEKSDLPDIVELRYDNSDLTERVATLKQKIAQIEEKISEARSRKVKLGYDISIIDSNLDSSSDMNEIIRSKRLKLRGLNNELRLLHENRKKVREVSSSNKNKVIENFYRNEEKISHLKTEIESLHALLKKRILAYICCVCCYSTLDITVE